MTPDTIPAALRDFAAAAAHSPDPAKSVADLALLIAQLFDQARETMEAMDAAAPGPLDHDEMAFPPLDPAIQVGEGRTMPYSEVRKLAATDYAAHHGPAATPFDQLPDEEISLWVSVALHKLRQEQPADQAAG